MLVRRTLALTVVAAAITLTVWPGSAGASTAGFTATPTTGGVGTTIDVRSVTACTLPAGVTGAPVAEVTLTQGQHVLGRGSFAVSSSGGWQGSLTVGGNANEGPAALAAFCLASPQAEGAFYAYPSLTFTVSGLARTGSPALPLSALGLALVVVGALLVRTRPRSALPRARD